MSVKVSSKYQVVIPEQVRSALNIKPGMEVEVIAKGNVAYIVPVVDLKVVKKKLAGKLDHAHLREKKDRAI